MPSTEPIRPNSAINPVANKTDIQGKRNILATICLNFSSVLLAFLTVAYSFRPDVLAAFTIPPVWSWWLVASLLTLMGIKHRRKRAFKVLVGLWLFFLIWFAEEPRSLVRGLMPLAELPKTQRIRIISLNCNSGDPQIASEVAALEPDIVLLQESPSRADVQQLARQLFGEEAGVLWGVDGSILARGEITPRTLSPEQSVYFVQGSVRLANGPQLEVTSLRLMTPPFRLDLWSPKCWNAYQENRRIQLAQLRGIQQQVEKVAQHIPVVVGGDFNAPQGDAVFKALATSGLYDSFARGGRGWGNTITNEFPVLRIDQIWASEHLEAHQAVAHPSLTSDHRAVIVDYRLR